MRSTCLRLHALSRIKWRRFKFGVQSNLRYHFISTRLKVKVTRPRKAQATKCARADERLVLASSNSVAVM